MLVLSLIISSSSVYTGRDITHYKQGIFMHVVYLCIALSTATTLTTMTSDHVLQPNGKTHILELGSLRREEKIVPEYSNPTSGFVTPERTTVAYTYYQRSCVLRVVHRNTPHNSSNPAWYIGYEQDRRGDGQEEQVGKTVYLKDAERWFGYYDLFWKYLENNKQIPQDWK